MDVSALATKLVAEAETADERRAIVLAGDRERGYETLEAVLEALPVGIGATTLVGPADRLRCAHLPQANADRLLGTTREVIALDCHEGLRPNALGRVVGAVDGGGLLVLLTPPLDAWPQRRGAFATSLAVAPFDRDDVTGRFRRRLVETLRDHRGIAIVDLDCGAVVDDGLTDPPPRLPREPVPVPSGRRFPAAAYEACLTRDQADAVAALEGLLESPRAVVLESNRGRGKSSAAGLAAAALAVDGSDVLVTAPSRRNATALFERAGELLDAAGGETDGTDEPGDRVCLETVTGGRIEYVDPETAVDRAGSADVVMVDEAAALPVSTLADLLDADRLAFATTIHGYEGAGRGFSVRFRDRLEASRHEVADVRLSEPIRYAAGDPIEVWSFRALLLDARPAVEEAVDGAIPETVRYRQLSPAELVANEPLLREVFGLLVYAHYRTQPADLARLLDAPNLETRALVQDGHVVSVALLAREGGLDEETRASMYDGARIRGHMLPDVLTSQLRDEAAGEPTGVRIVRIATHHALRSRGLGSRLLERVRDEFGDEVDWLGTGFGATPDLVDFWADNGYGAIHVSTTRNETSGEHSALMLAPTSDAGRRLHDRHAAWFLERLPAVCSDSLADLDPDVLRAICRSVDAPPPLDLDDHAWRVVAGAAYGPGLVDVDPRPFRRLVVRALVEGPDGRLSVRAERLLVRRALQARPWSTVADELEYHSTAQCMRAFGDALVPLVDRYGTDAALAVRDRYVDADAD